MNDPHDNPNHPTGTRGLLAVDKIGNRVLFLNAATLQTEDVLDGFACRVHELAISPDRTTAYAPIYGDGKHGDNPTPGQLVAVIDLATRRHTRDLSVAPYFAPHGLRWGPSGQLYCVCEDSGVVLELDVTTGEHRAILDVGSTNAHRIEVLPDGSKLYTENEEDPWATVLDLRAGQRLADVPTPGGLAGLGMHPDGSTVVFVGAARPELLVLDTASDTIVRTVALTGHQTPAQIARYSPDGRYLVVTSNDEALATILDDDLDTQATVHVGQEPMDMAYAADGFTVVIGNQGDGTLSVVDLHDARVLTTVEAGEGVESLAFY